MREFQESSKRLTFWWCSSWANNKPTAMICYHSCALTPNIDHAGALLQSRQQAKSKSLRDVYQSAPEMRTAPVIKQSQVCTEESNNYVTIENTGDHRH